MMLDTFLAQYDGKLVSFDNVPGNEGQSPQLIAAWCQFLGLPFQWANAVDWWDDSDETFLDHWRKIILFTNIEDAPKPGDIIVFSNQLPGSNHHGHLSLFVRHVTDDEWEGFDANWGGKSAHIQSHNWSYVLGWFTPRNQSVLEAQIPTAIADQAPSEAFDIEYIEPTTIVLKNDPTALFNLTDVSWRSLNQNPVSYTDQDTEVVVTAIAKHRLGGTYLMPDPSKAEGYNDLDCDLLPPDSFEIGNEEDARPADLPLSPRSAIDSIVAPISRPDPNDTIYIPYAIPRYNRLKDAFEQKNAVDEFTSGKYFVFKRLNGMISPTLQLGVPSGYWLNPDDLKPKPAYDWHDTYQPYDRPYYFTARTNGKVADLDGVAKDQIIFERQPILIAGWVKGPDGNMYGVPEDAINRAEPIWYGVHQKNLSREQVRETAQVVEQQTPIELPYHAKIYLMIQNSHVLKALKQKYRGNS